MLFLINKEMFCNLIIFILIVFAIVLLIKLFKPRHSISEFRNINEKKYQGIVFFDIDDTLTNTTENTDELVKFCLENNYKVGIITASNRPKTYVCNGNKKNNVNSPWMSDVLCDYMSKNKYSTYNTLSLTNGEDVNLPYFGSNKEYKRYGRQKGWQMIESARKNNIDPSNSYLFDDNIEVLNSAREVNPVGNFIHVDNNVTHETLNIQMLKRVLNKI